MADIERQFFSPVEARKAYELATPRQAETGEFARLLEAEGLACVELPLSSGDFARLSEGYGVCLGETPELLAQTYVKLDGRYGNEAGHVRKEVKFDSEGRQISDPKNYVHFSEGARNVWRERFSRGPKALRDFIEDGFEVQDALLKVARSRVDELEVSHPNISKLYFPNNESLSFLRLIRYDSYSSGDSLGAVAKPHFDIGGVTIQAYADAPGFWGARAGEDGVGDYYDAGQGRGQLFMGMGHEKVYGNDSPIKSLWHGVDRIIPTGVTIVPERTAVILFVDAPEVDYSVTAKDTTPYKKEEE